MKYLTVFLCFVWSYSPDSRLFSQVDVEQSNLDLLQIVGESPAIIVDLKDASNLITTLKNHRLFENAGWSHGFDLLLNGCSEDGEDSTTKETSSVSIDDYAERVAAMNIGRVVIVVETLEPLQMICWISIPKSKQEDATELINDFQKLVAETDYLGPKFEKQIPVVSSDTWIVFGNSKQSVSRLVSRIEGNKEPSRSFLKSRSYLATKSRIRQKMPTIEVSVDLEKMANVLSLGDLWKESLPLSEIRRAGLSLSLQENNLGQEDLNFIATSFALITNPRKGISGILEKCGELTELPYLAAGKGDLIFLGATNIDFKMVNTEFDSILSRYPEKKENSKESEMSELFGISYDEIVSDMSRSTGDRKGFAYWQANGGSIFSASFSKLEDRDLHRKSYIRLTELLQPISARKFGYEIQERDGVQTLVNQFGKDGMIWFDEWFVKSDSKEYLETLAEQTGMREFSLPTVISKRMELLRKEFKHSNSTIAFCYTSTKIFEITLDSILFDQAADQLRSEYRDKLSKSEYQKLLRENSAEWKKLNWIERVKPRSRKEEIKIAQLAIYRAILDTFGETIFLMTNEESGVQMSIASFAKEETNLENRK